MGVGLGVGGCKKKKKKAICAKNFDVWSVMYSAEERYDVATQYYFHKVAL